MSYLVEFRELVETDAKARFMRLWEEYCLCDVVDGGELLEILTMIKESPLSLLFGEYAETAVPLWQKVTDEKMSANVLRLLLDLQTTNSPLFADLALDYLKKRYGSHRNFNEFLRLVGLRFKDRFQYCIFRFELLCHMEKGKFVFHTGGWGVGEILDVSLVREHTTVEFEGTRAPKEISFDNAYRALQPLQSDHFLARRFGDPDTLEELGKDDPLALIHLLLRDLGPRSANEIKDELMELVIPEKEWTKWWQLARAKIKKDTRIKSAENAKDRFSLRSEELTHEKRLLDSLSPSLKASEAIQTIYQFSRDFSEVFKNSAIRDKASEVLQPILTSPDHSHIERALKLQALFLKEQIVDEAQSNLKTAAASGAHFIQSLEKPQELLPLIEIVAFKKQFLVLIRENRKDWPSLFLHMLFMPAPSQIRDYVLKELLAQKSLYPLVESRLKELLHQVTLYPEAFFWYFQKVAGNENVPLVDKEHQQLFLEALFVLLHYLEDKVEMRDLVKKIQNLLADKRYAIFRSIIENSSIEYLREVLLLASKCHTIARQDLRVLHSLAEVVQPELAQKEKEKSDETIWTTAEGYRKVQEEIERIGTVAMIDNAKEIEAARALGDLRENSEYKSALQRREQLQRDLKTLSLQLNQARILTRDDISVEEVGAGSVVELTNGNGKKVRYTLLGPWDANPEMGILSFQSKIAQAMAGKRAGESFEFQGQRYTVSTIKSYL